MTRPAGRARWKRCRVRRCVSTSWVASGSPLAVIALLVVGAILYVWLSDTFYVTRISVAGNVLTPAQEIVQTSGIGGQHMFWVNHAAASERIVNGIPSIKSARVDCQLPNRCVIKVQERQPSVAWRFGGAVTWIADDGMAFAAQRDTNLPLDHDRSAAGPGAAARQGSRSAHCEGGGRRRQSDCRRCASTNTPRSTDWNFRASAVFRSIWVWARTWPIAP